jgi:short subunit dehydrogenase-like uncharacterized protein
VFLQEGGNRRSETSNANARLDFYETSTEASLKKKKVEREVSSQDHTMTTAARSIDTDITVYGATGFVAKHVLSYFMQTSLSLPDKLNITLAGRNRSKLDVLRASLETKMSNLLTVTGKQGGCIFDVVAADSSDVEGLQNMAKRTTVVLSCAGPFARYGSNVVAACAETGADYVDITGELEWAGTMRAKHGKEAAQTGARIISFCGYDSIPSDLAVYCSVQRLKSLNSSVQVQKATTWHYSNGLPNGGTIHTIIDTPLNWRHCLFQPVPFLMADPLVLTHPATRTNPSFQATKNRMARAEWLNQLPSFESFVGWGVSVPFIMAPVNTKIVNASSIALNYGRNFCYRERHLPVGFKFTTRLGPLSIIPAVLTQMASMLCLAILKIPVIGAALASWLWPPGSGAPDYLCKAGHVHVYALVTSAPDATGHIHTASCLMEFEGDPGNWVTAQCVCESALSLIFHKDELPANSKDGFGTPVELLGSVLLKRLQTSAVRPVKISTLNL